MLIYRPIIVQHVLNKPLTKREIYNLECAVSQLPFWLVEILLRVYIVYNQCVYTHLQQFNRKLIVLQGFELLLCDGVVASHSPYRLIVATLVVVALIGGIGKSVGCRCQFPTLLHHLTHLVFLNLYLRVHQQHDKVVKAECNAIHIHSCHYVEQQLRHFNLQSVTVAADNPLQCFGMQQ